MGHLHTKVWTLALTLLLHLEPFHLESPKIQLDVAQLISYSMDIPLG